MTILGLIPARAGSKRLPGKNLLALSGKPLLAHTCEAALASGVLTEIYVNTDSADIAAVPEQHGVACPVLRPRQLAADDTPTRASNLFVLEFLAARGESYDAVMVLQPTSPLRSADDIRRAWALFEEHAPCAAVSVSPIAPESWTGRIAAGNRFEREVGDELLYRLNGAIYIYAWRDYLENLAPRKTVAYVMPPMRSVDVDTHEDLEYAEYLLSLARRNPPIQARYCA